MTEDFTRFLAGAVGDDAAQKTLAALSLPASVSVRLNPGKEFDAEYLLAGSEQVPWNSCGHFLSGRPSFTLDPMFHAGAYYVQDSSAMAVGTVARRFMPPSGRPFRVLDLCAAPGGKTTDLAASLRGLYGNNFLLVANEVMRTRAAVLADNVARWGDPCVMVTSCDPKAFARLEGFFDMIVADVPCSGEGMFRKDSEAAEQWSPDNVALCQARQRRIVADSWPSLCRDGILVYSTCTFNNLENDDNVGWISEELEADVCTPEMDFGWFATRHGYSLLPGFVKGEGQYCAALRKSSGSGPAVIRPLKKTRQEAVPEGLFSCGMRYVRRGDLSVAVPEEIASEAAAVEQLHLVMCGTAAGTFKGKDFIPHADLAMSMVLDKGAFAQVEVTRDEALSFLHKDPVTLADAPRGIVLLSCAGLGLGFVKNLGNRTNSLLPAERRIKMNIQ